MHNDDKFEDSPFNKGIRSAYLFFFGLLFVVMAMTTQLGFSEYANEQFSSLKIKILLLFLFFSSIYWAIYHRKISIPLIILAFLFPIYYLLLVILWKDAFSLNSLMLYFLWSFYIFILSINNVQLKTNLEYFLNVALATSLLIFVIGFVSVFFYDAPVSRFPDRIALGYENPNYFSQFCQVVIIGSIMKLTLFENRKAIKYILMVIIGLSLILIFLAKSRNVAISIAAFFLVFYTYKWRSYKYIFPVLVIVLVSTLAIFDRDELNDFSSGRVEIWEDYLKSSYDGSLESVMFGPSILPEKTKPMAHSYAVVTESEKQVKSKFHADNMYLELYFESGIVGVALFLLPYVYIWIVGRGNADSDVKRIWLSLVLSLLIQAGFASNFISFFSPVSIFSASIMLMILMRRHRRDERNQLRINYQY